VIALTLLRHGQSLWNRERRFSGWADVALSAEGMAQAERAGRLLAARGAVFDRCYTSCLERAADTARLALAAMGAEGVEVEQSWRLNERHYGALEGLRLGEAVWRFGLVRVLRCHRGFRARPPALPPGDARLPGGDPRYAGVARDELPAGESAADTLARVRPFWEATLAPALRTGTRVLIVSHRNTLRVLVRLVTAGRGSVPRFATGVPVVLELDDDLRFRAHRRLDLEAAA
jgi:2,3-bisphosphoglycerate-dependent phosphoglycerate mutase